VTKTRLQRETDVSFIANGPDTAAATVDARCHRNQKALIG